MYKTALLIIKPMKIDTVKDKEVIRKEGLTYHIIDSPLTRLRNFLEPIAAGILAAFFLIVFNATSSSASVWEDEEIEEEEELEGIELYDERADTVASASGEYITARSIASPQLFENIGDGTFSVEWDVYIDPAEGVTAHERIGVSLFYDSAIDANIGVERCQFSYSSPPNYQGEDATSNPCDGQTASWEDISIAASGYIGNLSDTEPIGEFMLQNGAYLRFTIEPRNEEILQPGDTIDSLEVHAEGMDERVVVGHTADSGRVEPLTQNATSSPEANSTPEPTATEEPSPSPTVESNETQPPADTPEGSPQPSPEPSGEDVADNENSATEEDTEGIPLSWIVGGIAVVLIGIGIGVFVIRRKRGYDDDNDDDEYLDEDVFFDSRRNPQNSRNSGSFN